MFDLGVVIGKFAPLTLGHINLITEAAVQSKHVLVVLSHDQRWLDKQSPRDQQVLNFKNRLRWLQQTYADTEHVTIDFIDEASVPEYPNGWQEYAALLGTKIFNASGQLVNGTIPTLNTLKNPGGDTITEGLYCTSYTEETPIDFKLIFGFNIKAARCYILNKEEIEHYPTFKIRIHLENN